MIEDDEKNQKMFRESVLGQEICTKKEVSNVILKCSSSGRGNQGNDSFGHPPNQEEGPKDGDKGRGRSRS